MKWKSGDYTLTRIECHSKKDEEGVTCLQYDDNKIVSGHLDSTIKVYVCALNVCVIVWMCIQSCTELCTYMSLCE